MELDRRFVGHTEKGSPQSFEFYGSLRNSMGWPDLLKRLRVVVLAEAGSGKSEEFKTRAAALSKSGEAAFLRTVTEAADRGFEASLHSEEREALSRWRDSSAPAWFFLDSVDEAKSRRLDIGRALSSLASAIGTHGRRAHVLLSGRPSDWESARDLASLNEALPIPAEDAPSESTDPGERVTDILRGKSKRSEPEEAALVVAMLPLDDDRVARFVRGKGIEPAEPFLAALEGQGLARFARRPLDLKWLTQHWRDRGSFGPLRAMLELSLSHRLRETNDSMARADELSLDACNAALDRIGAAMALGRVNLVTVPDSGLDLSPAADGLDLADLLPEWTAADRAKLLGRAAFAPSRSGFVRLDNDNGGAVRGFLAARWLSSLLAANCPRARIRELLFADTYGERLVVSSMAETIAWLAISHAWVADETIARDPWPLLNLGDPQSLPLDVRVRALRAILAANEVVTFSRLPEQAALRRLAQRDMGAPIRALWADFKGEPRARQLLLQLIWLGQLDECGDIAAEASFGAFPDRLTQVFSARALASAGSAADKARYGAFLSERRSDIDSEVFWEGAEDFFPAHFDARAFAEAIADPVLRAKSSAEDLSRRAGSIAARIEDAAGAEAALTVALAAMRSEPRGLCSEDHPLTETATECAIRLTELGGGAGAPPPIAIAATVECALASGRGRSREKTVVEKLRRLISVTPGGRRALLWAFSDRIRETNEAAHAPISINHLGIFGARVDLDDSDWAWLAEDAAVRPEESDALLAANATMRIWHDSGRPDGIIDALRTAAESRAAVAAAIADWVAPPPPSAEQAEMEAKIRAHDAERDREEREAAESWRSFLANLRADPKQLRSCALPTADTADWRIGSLWRIVDGLNGSRTRHSDGDLAPLVPIAGPQVVAEFAQALRGQWRAWSPLPRSERPDGEKNIVLTADLIGLLGVSVEALADPRWAWRLSEAEAHAAAIYATLEINGFPSWMEQLATARPVAAREALLRCCVGEWRRNDAGPLHGALDDLARSSPALCSLVGDALLDRLRRDPPPDARVLEPAVEVARKGCSDQMALSSAMLELFRAETSVDRRTIYLKAAFAADCLSACSALSDALDALPADGRKALARAALPRVFGGDWGAPAGGAAAMPLQILRRMVDIAYRDTPPSDDPDRANKGVYSPDARDHAQSARNNALTALIGRPGLATYEAIMSMRGLGFPIEPVVIQRWARDRASEDSEPSPWRPSDVATFERDFTSLPRTPRDLQTVAIHRFADLQERLLHGDFNQGATVAALPDERAVQNWFADAFKRESRACFSIEREPHVADEKEPDLRLEAKASDARLPIEIKVAESWSPKELDDALAIQLRGRYLRDPESKWGILLLVHQKTDGRKWKDGAGGVLTIQQLAERLSARAREIASQDANGAQMAVVVVDVSSKAAAPVAKRRRSALKGGAKANAAS